MGGMQDAARTTMAAKLISEAVASEHKPVKSGLLAQMLDAGVERIRVTDDDGMNLGSLTVVCGQAKARVVDERAFAAWVASRYPGELVQRVQPAFTQKLLDAATEVGEPVDTTTGEVVPGVELAAGEPYLSCRPTPDARARMRDTLLSSGLLSLPAGDTAAPTP